MFQGTRVQFPGRLVSDHIRIFKKKAICMEVRPIAHTLRIAGFCKELLKGKSNITGKVFVWLLPCFPW